MPKYLCLLTLLTALASDAAELVNRTEASLISSDKLVLSVSPRQASKLSGAVDLVVEGTNHSDSEAIVVLRLDDSKNPGYGNRVNLERVVPPGPFRLSQLLGGLTTPAKRALSLPKLQQVIVFAADKSRISLKSASLLIHPPLPAGSKAWDLGGTNSALWPGFEALTPNSKMLAGRGLRAIDRGAKMQAAEGLTTDGIQGIESIRLPLGQGLWAITLWLRDPGEWEYLPQVLNRSIKVNGIEVSQHTLTPDEWIDQVYLQRQWPEAMPGDTSYLRFSSGPNGKITLLADSAGAAQGVKLTFQGNQPHAGFVSAILAEPYTQGQYLMPMTLSDTHKLPVLSQVEQSRANWWNANWPMQGWPLPQKQGLTVSWMKRPPTLVAPGEWFDISFRVHSKSQVELALSPLRYGNSSLPTQVRYGHWQWQRSALQSTLLKPDDSLLKAGLPKAQPHPAGRLYHLRVKVPPKVQPGVYQGDVTFNSGDKTHSVRLETQVISHPLPTPPQSIGVYLEEQVQLGWFKNTAPLREQALKCDLSFLKQQGLTAVAPPLPTPTDNQGITQLLQRLRLIQEQGFEQPVLAYTPLKRLIAQMGVEQAADQVARTSRHIRAAGLAEPKWVSADEPSNVDGVNTLQASYRYIKAFSPVSRLAGHLNRFDDRKYLPNFDLLLANQGFGIDKSQLKALPEPLDVWLYNLDPVRHAAGFYLWQSGASGLMLWHARMPTADPFNPTDGRESDIQFLAPSLHPCPLEPDVSQTLFELTDGITDLKWLLWLEQTAQANTRARKLLQTLRSDVPARWQDMARLPESQLTQWREQIMTIKMETASQLSLQNATPQPSNQDISYHKQ